MKTPNCQRHEGHNTIYRTQHKDAIIQHSLHHRAVRSICPVPQNAASCQVSSKYGQTKVCHGLLQVDQSRSQHGSEICLGTVIYSTFSAVRSDSTGTAAVLEGRTARLYRMSVGTADWHSGVWHMAVLLYTVTRTMIILGR
jgi:hypothetical protein